ncbi:MAG: hypothetical protein JST68_30365 [Bacteroidetes bacterium]|nr:hypothetical protein [Bacteroidota bacterium]
MVKKSMGIELLKENFDRVEAKFMDFFRERDARWPSEKRDYLRNHHQSLSRFLPESISWEHLKVNGLPGEILLEMRAAFDAFMQNEEYKG